MNQICANEGYRQPVATPVHPVRRFVRLVDLGLESMVDGLLTWQTRYRDRMHLMALDDRLLQDMGLSLADVDREASKPFWRR